MLSYSVPACNRFVSGAASPPSGRPPRCAQSATSSSGGRQKKRPTLSLRGLKEQSTQGRHHARILPRLSNSLLGLNSLDNQARWAEIRRHQEVFLVPQTYLPPWERSLQTARTGLRNPSPSFV